MRDPCDALSAFFFSRRAFGVLLVATMLSAGVALAGCAPSAENPPPPPVEPDARARGAVQVLEVGDGHAEIRLYVVTQPETGCQYLMSSRGSLTPNMARTHTGKTVQLGCTLGAYEGLRP